MKLAERVGFEPTVRCRITSFQDWLLKPLGHLSSLEPSLHIITHSVGFVKSFFKFFQIYDFRKKSCRCLAKPYRKWYNYIIKRILLTEGMVR